MRKTFLTLIAAMLVAASWIYPAAASERKFYSDVQGKWSGPGEIVAGKYKGTRFNCLFNGLSQGSNTGLSIDGACRVGVFSQPMNASVKRTSAGYRGQFLDGESGEGMDVIGGRYTGSKLVVDIKRKDLRGVMVARLLEDDKLNITISVRVDSRLIPVIGMTLDRVGEATDGTVTSSVN